MKSLILTTLFLLFLPACATNAKWSTTDKWLAASMITGQAADYATTQRALDQGAVELNPIAKNMNSGEMAAFKAGGTGLVLWAADAWPKARKPILIIGGALGWGCAIHNHGEIK